jgi:hypothetical protein
MPLFVLVGLSYRMTNVLQDLSLLTNMTHEDIQKLQTTSKDEQSERAKFILLDQGEQAWQQLRSSHERVDMVLDNGTLCIL